MKKAAKLHSFVIGAVCLALIVVASARAQADQELIKAANRGDAAAVQRLLAGGADPNSQDTAGWTALRYAAAKGHGAVVQHLVASGADPNVRDDLLGHTVLMTAAMMGHSAVVQHLVAVALTRTARTGTATRH